MSTRSRRVLRSFAASCSVMAAALAGAQEVVLNSADAVTHRYADSNGVRIHYAVAGEGPLIVMVHGFPDYWYTWRHQIAALRDQYTVAAMDTRGYNLSDQPKGVENYQLDLLVGDVAAVIKAEGAQRATIVGHDWGGGIAWSFAALRPEMTERLIILNLPHPRNLVRELAARGQQHQNSAYARRFQQPNSHQTLTAEALATSLARGDEALHERYLEAFARSSFDAMMNYYRANFPREPYDSGAFLELPTINAPVLQFHGLEDSALLPGGLDGTWDHLTAAWTLVTLPGVGHWPHRDEPELVNKMMKAWLELHSP